MVRDLAHVAPTFQPDSAAHGLNSGTACGEVVIVKPNPP
jgi:hypothetical protein